MSALLEHLNEAQKAAVMHRDGPLVVFAGAGSGKTRIITTRIAYLIESGVKPWEILAVTFTNKAAAEMRSRVESICPEGRRCLITTFHSACARLLREFGPELGYDAHFTIYDDADSKAALKKVVQNLNPKGDLPTIVAEAKAYIHFAKTSGLFPADVERLEHENPKSLPFGAGAIYRAYQELLANSQAMDFNDLLLNMLLLLRNHKKVRAILQARYRYILVDEFQDTNQTQFELIHILAEHHQNLFVVGDDDQSIYSWRGATPSNIIDFKLTYPKAKQVALEENYRSTSHIVDAASAMIAKNKKRAPKNMFTKNDTGSLIDFHIESDGEMEAHWVVNKIREEEPVYELDDVAIFYRTNSQSRLLEEALTRENIPYTVFGAVEFYARLEVKDLLAYLRLMVNESDEIALRRIINVPTRGIGDKAVEQIDREAKKRGTTMLETIRALAAEEMPRLGPKLRYFSDLLTALKKELTAAALTDVVGILVGALEYSDYLKKKFPDQYEDKIDNIHELGAAMNDYALKNPKSSLADWLQAITLTRDETADDVSLTGVTLMTLHMAKGLEYPRVYVVGLEDGLLPHRNSLDDPAMIEEERRLFYVGMTRAREKLSLLAAVRRRNFNTIVQNQPSRFIKDVPIKYLKVASDIALLNAGGDFSAPVEVEDGGLSYVYDDEPPRLHKGAKVFHPAYGQGTIEDFESVSGQQKVIVRFQEHGFRKIKPSQLQGRR